MGDYSRAEAIIRESLEHSERLLPADHIRQSYPLKGLADALRKQGRFDEALPYAERAYVLRMSLSGDNVDRIGARFTLGICLWNLNRQDEAENHLNDTLAFFKARQDQYSNQIAELQELGFQ